MTFLDSREEFKITFGNYSTILPSKPTATDYLSPRRLVRDYADTCKLDIFMHLCRLNYVGNDEIDSSLHVQDICRLINIIKQVYHSSGRSRTDTPDELFDRFSHESISLPNDATTWSIQLCSSYLSALTPNLSDKITTDTEFKMHNLTTLTTKALQLDALCYVRHHASKCFNELVKQKNQITTLIRSMHTSHN